MQMQETLDTVHVDTSSLPGNLQQQEPGGRLHAILRISKARPREGPAGLQFPPFVACHGLCLRHRVLFSKEIKWQTKASKPDLLVTQGYDVARTTVPRLRTSTLRVPLTRKTTASVQDMRDLAAF